MPQLSQRLHRLFLKNIFFFLSFILYSNIFVDLKTIQYYKICNLLLFYIAIISYILQIHQIALTIDMCQENGWEALLLQLFFRIFLLTMKDMIP